MKNADNPAMPTQQNGGDMYGGLTKREYYAGLAMQALLGRPIGGPGGVAEDAVACADALLQELEK